MLDMLKAAGIILPETEASALKVAAAEPSAPEPCSDPSCSEDHSHSDHNHSHGHKHLHGEPNNYLMLITVTGCLTIVFLSSNVLR